MQASGRSGSCPQRLPVPADAGDPRRRSRRPIAHHEQSLRLHSPRRVSFSACSAHVSGTGSQEERGPLKRVQHEAQSANANGALEGVFNGRVDRVSLWRYLRALRADPPARASNDARRNVFTAALEQSEQLMKASEAVGPAARPLTLFYAISQAGRAVAAARAEEMWQLSGHGITVKRLDGPLVEMQLHAAGGRDRRDAFGRLTSVLGSPQLPSGTLLGDLWVALPEAGFHPLPRAGRHPALLLKPEQTTFTFDHPAIPAARDVFGLPGEFCRMSDPRPSLQAFLSVYPALAGYTLAPQGPAPFVPGRPPWELGLRLSWTTPPTGRPYPIETGDDQAWAFPALPGADNDIHPFLLWWAVLYALSMLARYQPDTWARHLDVDAVETAVPLEALLDQALDTLPAVILAVLTEKY